MVGQDKYMNNTSYLILKTKNLKTFQIATKNKQNTEVKCFINTALTGVQCIKTRKADIKILSKCIYVPTFLIIRGISIKSSSTSHIYMT